MPTVTIDARQLLFPGTGLALVTEELIREFCKSKNLNKINLFLPENVLLSNFSITSKKIHIQKILYYRFHTDYLDRLSWGKSVSYAINKNGCENCFIPYLYNFGNHDKNFVLIPDLVYRIYPDYGVSKNQSAWNLRGRLPFRPLVRSWEEKIATKASKVVVYSDYVKRHVQDVHKVPDEAFIKIPLAAPSWLEEKMKNAERVCRERYSLYCGGYAVRKNVPMLMRACGKVHEILNDFRCVFVGLNAYKDNPEFSELLQNPHISSSVIGTEKADNTLLASLYKYCEFTLYPSRCEGFGLPIVEAGSASKLCLCGDNSSMVEIQSNNDYRIDANNLEAWVEKIVFYWKNQSELNRAGGECYLNARRFSWSMASEKIIQLFSI